MRNLQKILALVLALIMSFSLVATAGAFSDDGDISDSYKTAVNVLNGLEVFKGYDNGATFQPKGNITRAEVAAIIYRIATGDVTDSQASIYSTYGQFTDVADGSWYAGYVNYCANAGYIKGRGNKIFDPQGQVTGYEALAMILRAVGYDKNGEFTGSNWQIRTASIANQRGITKNVTEGMLGQAATRETVAEILFRAILVNQVDFNANTLSYTEKATSLGYDSLKLEEIEGVITANEYADLNEDDTLPDGRTEMLVDGKDYTIDYTTTLDDIGESHIAYIQNGKKVLAINDAEEGNVTAESTAKIKDEDALKAFAKENSITLDKSAERYLNFSKGYRWMSDWRIRYEINFVSTFGGNDFNSAEAEYERERATYKWTVGLDEFKKSDGSYNVKQLPTGKYLWIYEASFKAGDEIGSDHQSNIQSIFDYADRFVEVKDQDTRDAYTYGEVYAGTSSLKDLSDSMSYNQFVTEYINQDTEATINDNENGNWVKIIDNDKDGVADYVLKVIYTTAQVDKVSDSAVTLDTKDIDFGSDEDNINEITSQKVVSADTLAVNDIVYYAVIDGKAQTYKATPVTAKIDKVNRNDLTATTADGTVYTQSGVCEHVYNPDYTPDVRGMADGVSYDMYLGRGDYMLVFVKSVAKSFTLLVDGYYNSTSKDDQYAVKAYQDGRINNVDVGRDGDLFIDGHTLNNGWGAMRKMGGTGNLSINAKDGDQTFLKTAVAGLDENGNLIPVDFASVYERGSHAMISIPKPVRSATQETYYTGIFKDGATEGYAYKTSKTAYDTPVVPVGEADNKVEIRALSSTVYYFVWKENNAYHVKEYVGYGAVPSLSVEELKTVEDIYAVGTRHERVSTSGDRDRYYYTADVVVVELNKAYKKSAEQIFVADSPIVGNGVRIDTLTVIRSNGVKEDIQVDLTKSILTYDVNYDEAGYKKVLPGVYNLYPTNEEGIYTIEYMNRNKIVSEGLSFMIGNVNTKQYTADSNYVGIDTMVTGGAKTYISNGEFQKKLTADTKYYTLNYEPEVKNAAYDRQNAHLDESTLSTVLKPRVEESKFIKDNFVYDLDREFDWQDRYGCYNNVLVCYDGSEAVYVVSFQNYDDDMPAARYGDHWELDAAGNRVGGYTDYAQHVWESMIPDPSVAQDTQTPTVELRTADGGKEQIAVLNPGTNDIPWAVWSKFAGRIDELYITPKANHSVSVDGKLSWTNQSKAFAAEEKNVPASNALTADDGVGKPYSFRVVNQVSGGMTEVLDYSYSFVPVNTDARLLDRNGSEVAGVIEIPDNSGNIEGYLEANFKLGSEFSTAVWNFSGKNNEESAVTMTMDAAGVVTAANSNLRVNEFTEVMLNTEFDVTVTAQSGDTITYKVKVIPSGTVPPTPGDEHSQEYTDAKAAYDAVDLETASKADLTALEKVITDALADPSVLKDGEEAEMNTWLQNIKDAPHYNDEDPGPVDPDDQFTGSSTFSLNSGDLKENGQSIVWDKAFDIVKGEVTVTAADLMPAGGNMPGMAISDITVTPATIGKTGNATDGWTLTNVPESGVEVVLTWTLSGGGNGGGSSGGDGLGDGDTGFDFDTRRARVARAGAEDTTQTGWVWIKIPDGKKIDWDNTRWYGIDVNKDVTRTIEDRTYFQVTKDASVTNFGIWFALVDDVAPMTVTIDTKNSSSVTASAASVDVNAEGKAAFTVTMTNPETQPTVEVTNEGGRPIVGWNSDNVAITRQGDTNVWDVVISNVNQNVIATVGFKALSKIALTVADASKDYITDVAPAESDAGVGPFVFTMNVADGCNPKLSSSSATALGDAGADVEFTKGEKSGNTWVWTLTITNPPMGFMEVELEREDSKTITLRAAAGTNRVDTANSELGSKEAIGGEVSFTVKMADPDMVPALTANGSSASGWTYEYNEVDGTWKLTKKSVGSSESCILDGAVAEWVTITATGMTTSRTKMATIEEKDSKLNFKVKLTDSKTSLKSDGDNVVYGTEADADGWYTVAVKNSVYSSSKKIELKAAADPKVTLLPVNSSASMVNLGLGLVGEYQRTGDTAGKATFKGVRVEGGYIAATGAVKSNASGDALSSGTSTAKLESDGTWTIVVTFTSITEDTRIYVEAKAYNKIVVTTDNPTDIIIENAESDPTVGGDKAIVKVKVGADCNLAVTESLEGLKVEPTSEAVDGYIEWTISVPYTSLTNAKTTLTLTANPDAAPVVTVDKGVENGALMMIDGQTVKSRNGKASFDVKVERGGFPLVSAIAETNGGASIAMLALGDALAETGEFDSDTVGFSYTEGATEGLWTTWTIDLTNVMDAITVTVAAVGGVKDELSEATMTEIAELLPRMGTIRNFAADETMESDGTHIVTITGDVSNWFDMFWWEDAIENEATWAGVLPEFWANEEPIGSWDAIKTEFNTFGYPITDNDQFAIVGLHLPALDTIANDTVTGVYEFLPTAISSGNTATKTVEGVGYEITFNLNFVSGGVVETYVPETPAP